MASHTQEQHYERITESQAEYAVNILLNDLKHIALSTLDPYEKKESVKKAMKNAFIDFAEVIAARQIVECSEEANFVGQVASQRVKRYSSSVVRVTDLPF